MLLMLVAAQGWYHAFLGRYLEIQEHFWRKHRMANEVAVECVSRRCRHRAGLLQNWETEILRDLHRPQDWNFDEARHF